MHRLARLLAALFVSYTVAVVVWQALRLLAGDRFWWLVLANRDEERLIKEVCHLKLGTYPRPGVTTMVLCPHSIDLKKKILEN